MLCSHYCELIIFNLTLFFSFIILVIVWSYTKNDVDSIFFLKKYHSYGYSKYFFKVLVFVIKEKST